MVVSWSTRTTRELSHQVLSLVLDEEQIDALERTTRVEALGAGMLAKGLPSGHASYGVPDDLSFRTPLQFSNVPTLDPSRGTNRRSSRHGTLRPAKSLSLCQVVLCNDVR
jgi:hypothetical protein